MRTNTSEVRAQRMSGASDRISRALLDGLERDFLVAHQVGGLHAALGLLNARTLFRFTAFRVIDDELSRVNSIYDRDNPGTLRRSSGELCAVARAVADDGVRVSAEVSRTPAPLRLTGDTRSPSHVCALVWTDSGKPWAVLCHYDVRLRLVPASEQMVMNHFGDRITTLCPELLAAQPVASAG